MGCVFPGGGSVECVLPGWVGVGALVGTGVSCGRGGDQWGGDVGCESRCLLRQGPWVGCEYVIAHLL